MIGIGIQQPHWLRAAVDRTRALYLDIASFLQHVSAYPTTLFRSRTDVAVSSNVRSDTGVTGPVPTSVYLMSQEVMQGGIGNGTFVRSLNWELYEMSIELQPGGKI